ncbi:MAG: hypothetical protein HC836_40865 [Richelia sp. RM2_1_2]|nr:hypothetical protein [Richelia sp. RM2_1_2]
MLETLTTIDLTSVWPVILEIGAGVVLAMGIWAIKKLIAKIGLEADEKVRDYLIGAIQSGITFGKNKALAEVNSDDWSKVDVRDIVLAQAVTYTLTRVPDAVKKFKLTEQDIKDLVLARLEK